MQWYKTAHHIQILTFFFKNFTGNTLILSINSFQNFTTHGGPFPETIS
jgi:hypothetical protein